MWGETDLFGRTTPPSGLINAPSCVECRKNPCTWWFLPKTSLWDVKSKHKIQMIIWFPQSKYAQYKTVLWWWTTSEQVCFQARWLQAGRDLWQMRDLTFHLQHARNHSGSRLRSGCQRSGMQHVSQIGKQMWSTGQSVKNFQGSGCRSGSEVGWSGILKDNNRTWMLTGRKFNPSLRITEVCIRCRRWRINK